MAVLLDNYTVQLRSHKAYSNTSVATTPSMHSIHSTNSLQINLTSTVLGPCLCSIVKRKDYFVCIFQHNVLTPCFEKVCIVEVYSVHGEWYIQVKQICTNIETALLVNTVQLDIDHTDGMFLSPSVALQTTEVSYIVYCNKPRY